MLVFKNKTVAILILWSRITKEILQGEATSAFGVSLRSAQADVTLPRTAHVRQRNTEIVKEF